MSDCSITDTSNEVIIKTKNLFSFTYFLFLFYFLLSTFPFIHLFTHFQRIIIGNYRQGIFKNRLILVARYLFFVKKQFYSLRNLFKLLCQFLAIFVNKPIPCCYRFISLIPICNVNNNSCINILPLNHRITFLYTGIYRSHTFCTFGS